MQGTCVHDVCALKQRGSAQNRRAEKICAAQKHAKITCWAWSKKISPRHAVRLVYVSRAWRHRGEQDERIWGIVNAGLRSYVSAERACQQTNSHRSRGCLGFVFKRGGAKPRTICHKPHWIPRTYAPQRCFLLCGGFVCLKRISPFVVCALLTFDFRDWRS